MSDKKYTPYEAALEVLKKAQEVYNKNKEKKAEVCKDEMDKCGDMKVVDKKEDIEKFMTPQSTVPGSVATTGGPSIGSQIGFGKSDKKEHSGAVGDVDPKIISDMKAKLADSKKEHSKKEKKLPEFLKKKKMKKAMGDSSQASAAPKAPKAGSPQPPSTSIDQGWSNAKKSEGK
jgi:hypothetical protein